MGETDRRLNPRWRKHWEKASVPQKKETVSSVIKLLHAILEVCYAAACPPNKNPIVVWPMNILTACIQLVSKTKAKTEGSSLWASACVQLCWQVRTACVFQVRWAPWQQWGNICVAIVFSPTATNLLFSLMPRVPGWLGQFCQHLLLFPIIESSKSNRCRDLIRTKFLGNTELPMELQQTWDR